MAIYRITSQNTLFYSLQVWGCHMCILIKLFIVAWQVINICVGNHKMSIQFDLLSIYAIATNVSWIEDILIWHPHQSSLDLAFHWV